MMSEYQPTTTNATHHRTERKYPIPKKAVEETTAILSKILPVYHHNGSGPWSSLRSIYLDTSDHKCYQEYVDNLSIRRKIRIRQYGVNNQFDRNCWVELKIKNENLSLKQRFRCQISDLPPLMQGEDILKRIQKQNADDIAQIFKTIRSMIVKQQMVPVIRIDYERLAFQRADDPSLRVTLDREIGFTSSCRQFSGDLAGLIVEVKHHGDCPDWLPHLQERLGLEQQKRFSKFGRGMKQLLKLHKRKGSA